MRFFQGLHQDNHPADQPENTYRDARNIALSKQRGAVTNESGTTLLAQFPEGLFPIGRIILPDDSIIVFLCGGGNSEIGRIQQNTYTTILNDPALNFHPNYPITGTYRIVSAGINLSNLEDVQVD